MAKLIILAGLPILERDMYAKMLKGKYGYEVISRDAIRDSIFGRGFETTNKAEEEVMKEFDFKLGKAYLCRLDIVLNSTNCSENYIDKLIAECPTEYDIELKFFDISLTGAYWSNFWNFILGRRFVPFKVVKELKRNFDNINKKKYKNYVQTI